jgi:prevent-host-death family protein
MREVSIKQARQSLRALLDDVAAGEEIVLLRRGRAVARLVPAAEAAAPAEPCRSSPLDTAARLDPARRDRCGPREGALLTFYLDTSAAHDPLSGAALPLKMSTRVVSGASQPLPLMRPISLPLA